jgi:tetratricopeptide (TPR) repeat protein
MPDVRIARTAVVGVLIALALATVVAQPETGVRAWRGTLQLPTYAEDAPNPNPPFDLFTFGRFNYPYPLRDALTDRRETVTWRTLNLENEYLRLTVLPDLGGHIYSCLDKRSGREMFYANSAIKKALIGYRGAWAAFGVEFNFPVSHNWVSMSPVDFAVAQHPDGSGSIWVGNVDQVYGSQWRVELRLQPGRSVLDQHVALYNRSDVRHRYYWWSNGAVQVWDDSHLVYPTELMATHGFTAVEPWPIDRKGRDLSIIRNEVDGPVSLFTYQTREPFVGVYHPRTQSGTVHVADPSELPVHKFWSWGNDRDAATWRTALSDDDSAYVELQAGLFRNQETYAFLEPQESVRFSEHWLPVRDLGGITRANVDGVLYMERTAPGSIRLELDVTRDLPGARISVRQGSTVVLEKTVTLSPREVWRAEVDHLTTAAVTFDLVDASGTRVMAHTEQVFDRTPASEVRLGSRETEPVSEGSPRSADEIVENGMLDELEGRRLAALDRYRDGLAHNPHSLALLKAAGRLSVALGWAAGGARSSPAIEWLEEASARNTTDFETRYYLGLALVAAGRPRDARPHFEAARRFRATRVPALMQLARLSAADGNLAEALRCLQMIGTDSPQASLAGALEVAVLRRLDRPADARERAQHWQAIDPTSSLIRHESSLLGEPDQDLWPHLGADANRVLDLVDQYLAIGSYKEALALLEHEYPQVEPPARENGAVTPAESPLVAYYRGYVRQQLGGDAGGDYAKARVLSTKYTFPSRPSSYAVLNDALRLNPEDGTARFLLGSLYLASGRAQPAIEEWQRVRRMRPAIPTLHRNLGLALLQGTPNYKEARGTLEEGIEADGENVEGYLALDGVLSATHAAPRDRVAALRRFPPPDRMPSPLVYKLAIGLAEAGQAAEAERLFHGRFFPKEEGGTSVRAVYAQVRLASARAAAGAGNCTAAREMLDTLSAERQDLPFTAGGLGDVLRPPTMARQAAVINWICGRRDAARAEWRRLAQAASDGGAPMALAIADEARSRLGAVRTTNQRRRLEAALEAMTRALDSGDTSNPGYTELTRASLLAALDRSDESRRSMTQVFLFPDRNLSHAWAHAIMQDLPPEGGRHNGGD